MATAGRGARKALFREGTPGTEKEIDLKKLLRPTKQEKLKQAVVEANKILQDDLMRKLSTTLQKMDEDNWMFEKNVPALRV